MKRFIISFVFLVPLFAMFCTPALHAEEKRLGQIFIDAFYAKDEAAMKEIISNNKDSVAGEVEMMLAYAVENRVGWMVEVCEKMATLYKEETGDDSVLNEISRVMAKAMGESEEEAALNKLTSEVIAIGKGHWKITSVEYNDNMLRMDIGVDPEIGMDIEKGDVEAVGKTIETLIPEAYGQVTWSSFGVGVASLLRESGSTSWKTSK